MKYVDFNPKIHDINKIATLHYNVDFRTYDKFFSSKDDAISAIEKSLKKDGCTKIIYDDENIVGILTTYTYDKQPKIHFSSLKLLIIALLDYFVLCDIKKDDILQK